MFFLIFASVLQICFLPGFILFLYLNRKTSDPKVLLVPAFSFALSLIINYLFVTSLTYFNIYTRTSLVVILIVEVLILVLAFIFHKLNFERYLHFKIYADALVEIRQALMPGKSLYDKVKVAVLILSFLLLTALLIAMVLNIGNIFQSWDAVFSWNRWAIDFYNNKIPSSTYHYPQLIPANWSVSYVLCGYPLQFISRGLMPLFLIFQVCLLILAGIRQSSLWLLISVFFVFLGMNGLSWTDGSFFLGMNRSGWTDGCVDVPVAFYSVISFICLVMVKKEDYDPDKWLYIISGSLFACGAAVTKQAGLFILVAYPLLLLVLTKDIVEWPRKRIGLFIGFYLLMVFLIVIPFYLRVEIAIRNRQETSEIHYVTNEIYNGASYFERLINAGRFFSNVFRNRLLFIICSIPFLLSLTDRTFRRLSFVFVIPYALIWALFFSYDLRNAAIIIPFYCIGIGIGFEIILKKITNSFNI
jgi:hypothetical protein